MACNIDNIIVRDYSVYTNMSDQWFPNFSHGRDRFLKMVR